MYRFIDFNDEKIDSLFMMELSDLAKTLVKDEEYEVDLRVHSYIDTADKKIYASHFWNHRSEKDRVLGMKSDVYLRALGNYHFTDQKVIRKFVEWSTYTNVPRFARQLFSLAEDLRIEEICKRKRPGMRREFSQRRKLYLGFFQNQWKVNMERSLFTDVLFNLAYLVWNTETPLFEIPGIHANIDPVIVLYREKLERLFDAGSTDDVAKNCMQIVTLVEDVVQRDLLNDYFHLHHDEDEGQHVDYRDLLRKDKLINNDQSEEKATGDEEFFKEEMKTWHRETSEPGENFLQFDLDQGTQTDILANEAREGEAGDQALAIVKGKAGKSQYKDYSDMENLGRKNDKADSIHAPYGVENRHAEAIFLSPTVPKNEEIHQYLLYKKSMTLYQKKLKRTIDMTLEHKKQLPRTRLQIGRLNNKLIHFFTDDEKRLFYKKTEKSTAIDAVFSLLIDCSASMQDKMEETKKGITLFHEALKSVRVPHEITGFWEDANDATRERQPNYFSQPITFSNSLKKKAGPEIMQLKAEEDNRDGFAIRIMTERLLSRGEKQKFLIVFSDGEPAAFGYDQNGIIDTHMAVIDARKKGIEVINIYLSVNEVADEQRKVFQNIYGAYSLVSPSIETLPELLFPLLKKLLLKSLNE
ncbi:vWA domain-containing protein [Bacillus sp. SD088]|uniref:vWA domain-containing protein n=1 Tax=Bacillus sp. SD088 TaxID=2782012 RepID=UPI001A96F146|nr:VWA domain-containing protein [Bacillus sp. SD088]MBO0995129.1 VWA domain-containing protein [Bacillus sp. SD088]